MRGGMNRMDGGMSARPFVAGDAFDTDAEAIFAAFTTPPDGARKIIINDSVLRLKAGNVWDILDVLYRQAAADSQAARINWKNPATFTASLVNAPTFTTDRGFTGNGSNQSVSSGFTPSTAGGVYAQDNAHISARSLSNLGSSAANRLVGMAAGGSTGRAGLIVNNAGVCSTRVNTTLQQDIALATTLGHFMATRNNGTTLDLYHDGSAVATGASHASDGNPTQAICFLSDVAVSFSSLQIASASIGGYLDATKAAALAADDLAYMQAVGAA